MGDKEITKVYRGTSLIWERKAKEIILQPNQKVYVDIENLPNGQSFKWKFKCDDPGITLSVTPVGGGSGITPIFSRSGNQVTYTITNKTGKAINQLLVTSYTMRPVRIYDMKFEK